MKCFLSHSSKDKNNYVRLVAEKLRTNMIVYDEYTFESGMKTSTEILTGLDRTDIFVLFLSDAALNSNWVRDEIIEAKDKFDNGDIERIYPILIDSTINHNDHRIPEWMKSEYNLRLISRPVVAVRRINQRLRELSWMRHPHLSEREKIFVGRNDLIRSFEERFDDLSREMPSVILASGLKKIGRRSLLKNALVKSNISKYSYEPFRVHLSQDDGIEGFIIKLNDLGISSIADTTGLMRKTVEEKIRISTSICASLSESLDIVLIEDNGSIVNFDGGISDWFLALTTQLPTDKLIFAIAPTYKLFDRRIFNNNKIFHVSVPELNQSERSGLLKRYCELEKISLSRDDFGWISAILKGYPEQVFFTVDLLKDKGVFYLKNNSNDIVEFNKNRSSIALKEYFDNEIAMELLRFLSGYEFISYKFIEDVCSDDNLLPFIDQFLARSICEEIGSSREYIRVNDTIRDFIIRNKLHVSTKYKSKLIENTKEFLKSYQIMDYDASEYYGFIKIALEEGFNVDEALLIPSHFILAIRNLYEDRRYSEVVKICDHVLNNSFSLEKKAADDIRYFLCLSLARLRLPRFLQEVQKISGCEHAFLLGFYYRRQGRYNEAETRLREAMQTKRSEKRARRELVTVYLLMECWDDALGLARQNYVDFPDNPFHIQAYFNCLIQQGKSDHNRHQLCELIDALTKINSERSKEMLYSARALMAAIYDGRESNALDIIDEAIIIYNDNYYPVLTKLEISMRYLNAASIKECINKLKPKVDKNSPLYNAVKKGEAIYLAISGDKDKARSIIERDMSNFSQQAKDRLLDRISTI